MNTQEAAACLTYTAQLDPRVQVNDAQADLWAYALMNTPVHQARWVIRDYYARPTADIRPLTPGELRRLVGSARERGESVRSAQSALERRQSDKAARRQIEVFRGRDPEEWDRLAEIGAQERRRELEGKHGQV